VFLKLSELWFTPNKSFLVRIRSWSANFDTKIHTSSETIEVLFVVTKKDFDVLLLAIKYAIRNLDNFNLAKISIITPSLDLEELPTAIYELSEKIQVYRDEEFINAETIDALRSNFSARAGWYIQQILKLEFVRNSTSGCVLVVDADTVLTKKRNWIDTRNVQILMPSEEFHAPYYEAIEGLGLKVDRRYSFVSHHMLYQKELLSKLLLDLAWRDSTEISEYLIANYSGRVDSPISLDYELYAQYLLASHPDKCKFEKWSNLPFSRGKFTSNYGIEKFIETMSKKYASVSLHSWM
jgi:hypothetical protein